MAFSRRESRIEPKDSGRVMHLALDASRSFIDTSCMATNYKHGGLVEAFRRRQAV